MSQNPQFPQYGIGFPGCAIGGSKLLPEELLAACFPFANSSYRAIRLQYIRYSKVVPGGNKKNKLPTSWSSPLA